MSKDTVEYKGVVKFFNEVKQFGFITCPQFNGDVFVHGTKLKESIEEGDDVSFNIVEGKKGPNAINVKKI